MERLMIMLGIIVLLSGVVVGQITIGSPEDETDFPINLEEVISTTGGNSSFNQSFGDTQWWRLDGSNSPPTANWNMNSFGFDNLGYFSTPQNQFNLTPSDDGSNHFLTSDVGGANYLSLETAGAFFQLYANPNPSNDNLLATITETQGADTQLNFYEGGTGHNRFWSSGSVRIGGGASRFCSNLTTDVDCNTPLTGADLVVNDSGWFGGKLFSFDWSNVSVTSSQVSGLNGSTIIPDNIAFVNQTNNFTEPNIFSNNVTLGSNTVAQQFLKFDNILELGYTDFVTSCFSQNCRVTFPNGGGTMVTLSATNTFTGSNGFTGTLNSLGIFQMDDYLSHLSDTDTYFGFPSGDVYVLNVGGDVFITATEQPTDSSFIINEASQDINFRIESDNRFNAFSIDAGQDTVIMNATNVTIESALKLEPRPSPPTASLGMIYVDSDTNELCFYNTTDWVGLSNGGTCA